MLPPCSFIPAESRATRPHEEPAVTGTAASPAGIEPAETAPTSAGPRFGPRPRRTGSCSAAACVSIESVGPW